MNTPLLSAFYFGSVEHYALLARHDHAVIDLGEHYERQSYRTRTSIIGPNGVQHLNARIARDHGHKMPMHTVGLTRTDNWPQQHLHAIRSAYGQTPWFIHYIDEIEHVLSVRHERLADLLLATMGLGLRWLGLRTRLVISERYVGTMADDPSTGLPVHSSTTRQPGTGPPPTAFLDLRSALHPKKPVPSGIPTTAPYPQVFAERHGFVPRMSVIDLVCNRGPEAARTVCPK